MVSINVKSRSKSLKSLSTDELTIDSKVSELIALIKESNNIDPHRIRLTHYDTTTQKNKPLDVSKTFAQNGIASELKTLELSIKDLGPQLSWRTVFKLEYLGPLLIHPLIYWYYNDGTYTETQTFAFYFVIGHFLKREYESFFVHKFSNDTMPLFNLFKNSSHYWLLSGFNISYFIYGATALTSESTWGKYIFYVNDLPSSLIYLITAVFVFAEASNFKTHSILANLRNEDSKRYVIPYGYGFDLISCPNYTFESLSWLAYAILVGNWSAWLFLAISSGQMFLWAVKKHKRYLKTFGDEYKKLKRAIYIPYVI
ncbi:3-oxo-5a-steroid 4 dehydrogenase [Scheffersomyces amazonensis]|uniref:3-oxo-5a-steroid 4 dehydrogenase n=1 Tax=Scheffersomyces amazonensis TaxID=1078765 RepID=UPI00315D331F